MSVKSDGRFSTLLAAAVIPSATVFFFAPLQIYFSNSASFSVPPVYHALAGLVLAGAATIAATAALLLLPRRYLAACTTIVLATAVGLWIQGNLLVWRYGPMDGRPIDWGAYWKYGAIDGTVWLLLAACCWRFSRTLAKNARAFALTFMIMQTVALCMLAFRTRELLVHERIQIEERGKYELSTKRNIVLLIFDEFQGDIFPEFLAQNPRFKELFDGFVYFPDTVAGASFTEIAVPFLLTGDLYDNSVPRSQFLEQALALPLLLAKPFRVRGSLRVSRAPASLGDLPKTIAAAAGIDGALPGQDLFALREDAVRTRTFASFVWSSKSSEYVQPITLYSISGPVWLDESWKREKVLPARSPVSARASDGKATPNIETE